MMFDTKEFLIRARLDQATLEIWIAEGWLIPRADAEAGGFAETDLARALLIRDLIDDLGVNAEGVGVILHLLDQMHGLRAILAEFISARSPLS